jgi:hypothetical protein
MCSKVNIFLSTSWNTRWISTLPYLAWSSPSQRSRCSLLGRPFWLQHDYPSVCQSLQLLRFSYEDMERLPHCRKAQWFPHFEIYTKRVWSILLLGGHYPIYQWYCAWMLVNTHCRLLHMGRYNHHTFSRQSYGHYNFFCRYHFLIVCG